MRRALIAGSVALAALISAVALPPGPDAAGKRALQHASSIVPPAHKDRQQVAMQDPRLTDCLVGMRSGYASGLQETFCRGAYDLPSPFFFKCAHGLRIGFKSETARRACVLFFADQSEKAGESYVRGR